jgi:hypothetical protein
MKSTLVVVLTLLSISSACSAPQTQALPDVTPTKILDTGHGITSEERELPLTDAEVPRISLDEANAALESGAAVMVDVRSPSAFETSHVAGAISVPLGTIERELESVPLSKEQWIITYCT